jgi:hypothetical protein
MMLDEIKNIKNKTMAYLLPLIANKTGKASDFKDSEHFPKCNFINVFRYCEEYPNLNNHIFVIYKYNPSPQFKEFIDKFKKYPTFHSIIDNDKYSIIIVFEIPFDSLGTLNHFDNGAFSKFKLEDKKRILNFYSVTSNDKFAPAGVLYKKEWRRLEIEELIAAKLPPDAELSSIPYLEEETYYLKYKTIDNE